MALKFTMTDQASLQHGVKMLVYGLSGSGKTVLCSTAPVPVILSAEAGLLSLRRFSLPVIEIRSVEDLTEAHRWCLTSHEAKMFQTVCIDSISEIGELVLANAKKQVKDPRQAYGELIEKMMTTIKAYRDLPGKHVYMSAKMEPVKDEMTGIVRYMASMPGSKLGPQLPYLYDEVFRLGINKTTQGEQYRFLQTSSDLQYDAKDRSGSLDPVEPPDLTRVINKILGVK